MLSSYFQISSASLTVTLHTTSKNSSKSSWDIVGMGVSQTPHNNRWNCETSLHTVSVVVTCRRLSNSLAVFWWECHSLVPPVVRSTVIEHKFASKNLADNTMHSVMAVSQHLKDCFLQSPINVINTKSVKTLCAIDQSHSSWICQPLWKHLLIPIGSVIFWGFRCIESQTSVVSCATKRAADVPSSS